MNASANYIFTRQQLYELLYGTIEMLIEYRDRHGHAEESAKFYATSEMIEGLDAERELHAHGEIAYLTLQQPAPAPGFAQPSMFPAGEDSPLFTLAEDAEPEPEPGERCIGCGRRPEESKRTDWDACDRCGKPICDSCYYDDYNGKGHYCSLTCANYNNKDRPFE